MTYIFLWEVHSNSQSQILMVFYKNGELNSQLFYLSININHVDLSITFQTPAKSIDIDLLSTLDTDFQYTVTLNDDGIVVSLILCTDQNKYYTVEWVVSSDK